MAQFRTTIQGARGEASRLGTKHSGMHVHVQSWEGQVNVVMYHKPTIGDGQDWVRVSLAPHASDGGLAVVLYEGPCDAWKYAHDRRLSICAWQVANHNLKSASEDAA